MINQPEIFDNYYSAFSRVLDTQMIDEETIYNNAIRELLWCKKIIK